MNEVVKHAFEQLGNALKQLELVACEPVNNNRTQIDATIHRFEFCIELFWKSLKKQLFIEHKIEANSPKNVLQHAYALKLIDNETMWIAMFDDRNLTSHTYKQALADEVYKRIKNYVPFLKKQYENLVINS